MKTITLPTYFIAILILFMNSCEKSAVQQQETPRTNVETPTTKTEVETVEVTEADGFVPTIAIDDTLAPFIPTGYCIYDKTYGDLNKDGIADCILTIKKIDIANIIVDESGGKLDRNRRGIIILLKQAEGYTLATKNYDCFSSENEEGGIYFAPELSVEAKKGNLFIEYHHGRYGYWSYTFRWNQTDFELIGYDVSENSGPVVNRQISMNFLSKKKLVRKNVNENAEGEDEIFEDKWEQITSNPTIKLSAITDFDELNLYDLK
jgi:hypothetical protein